VIQLHSTEALRSTARHSTAVQASSSALQTFRGARLGRLLGAFIFSGLLASATWCAAQTPTPSADAAATPATAVSADTAPAQTTAPKPRSLRDPLPDMGALPAPTIPEVFTGTYPGALPYTVVPRKPEMPLHPCVMCHDLRKTDPTVRVFKVAPPPDGAPHAGVLRHGKGRMWCLDCHYANDRQWLRTVDNRKLDFNDGPLQCGQCHSARYRDWVFGAHGKRVADWTGERQLYSCMHCHDPHVPVLPPRAPSKAPPLRAGLKPMVRVHAADKHAHGAPAAAVAPSVAPSPAQGSSNAAQANKQ
jgi:hypothetical protein